MSDRPSPIEPASVFAGLRWSSILRGAVLDNVLTLVASIPIVLYFAGTEAFAEDEQTADQAMDRALATPEFLVCQFVVGLSVTVYAAYWASRRAGLLYLRHGGWTALGSALLGLLLLLGTGATTGPTPPLWYEALSLVLMLPAGVLGGWLASLASPRSA